MIGGPVRVNVPSSELESTEPKLTYLGYDKFLAIYTTDQERIVLESVLNNKLVHR